MYQLHQGGPETEELEDEDLAAANHWVLPAQDFDGVWESLVFDENIKDKVLYTNLICIVVIIPPAKRSFRGVYCFQPVRDSVIPSTF